MDRAAAPPFSRFLPPRYRVDRVLSSGERYATLEVFDSSLRQAKAVVKVQQLAEEKSASESEGAFRRFCAKLMSIRHDLMAAPYTFGTFASDAGHVFGYTVRDFVGGTPLSNLVLPMPEEAALTAILQVCHGLEAAHAVELYHGDLKPENIIVRRAPNGKIDDLSLCVLIDFSYRPVASAGTLNEVTLQYIAPEMLTGQPPDRRTDLYALGVMLYRLLSGRFPFDGASLPDVMRKQRSRDYTPLGAMRPSLLRAVEKLLEPNPVNRPDSVQALIATLDDSAPARRSVASRPSGFVGREAEIQDCLNGLDVERPSVGVGSIAICGGRGCGVTAFLRELQDRLESRGLTVLTGLPRAAGGVSLQVGLREQVHALARRSDPTSGGTEHVGAPDTATDLLDDLFVAAQERRVVLFVDDWSLCDVSEITFLQRLILQDRAATEGMVGRTGRCQVVMGDSQGHHTTEREDAITRLGAKHLKLCGLSEQDTVNLLAIDGTLPRRYASRVHAASGGYPRSIRAMLDHVSSSGAELSDAAFEVALMQAASATADAEKEREIAALHGEPHGEALLALALWGDALAVERWDALRARLTEGTDEPRVDRIERAGRAFVLSRHRHLGECLAQRLNESKCTRIGDALIAVTWDEWRSYEPDTLLMLLRVVGRIGTMPPRGRWRVCRALMVLLERGRCADIEAVAAALSKCSDVPWWVALFRDAARAGAGSMQELPVEVGRADAYDPAQFFRTWIHARVLMRARYRKEALRVLEMLSAVTLPCAQVVAVALAEDYALAAAECGITDTVTRVRRQILRRIARWLPMRRRHKKRDHVGWRARLRSYRKVARYHRVRGRAHLLKGQLRRALVACRTERRLNQADGNALREAACLNNEGVLLIHMAANEAAAVVLERCAHFREALDDEHGLVVVLNNMAAALSGSGNLGRAVGVLNRARIIAARNNLSRQRNLALVNLAVAYGRRGQLRDAQRVCRQVRRHCGIEGDVDAHARALFNGGCVAVDMFNPIGAEACAARLGHLRGLHPQSVREPSDDVVRAELAFRARDWAHLHTLVVRLHGQGVRGPQAAVYEDRVATEAGESVVRRPLACEHTCTTGMRLRLALQRRRHKRLRLGSASRMVALARRHACPREAVEWLVAHLERQEGDTDAAVDLGLSALSWFEFREGHDDLQIEVRARLAGMLRARARHVEAWRLIEDALLRFRRLERKLRRWPRGVHVLLHLQEHLQRALKGTVGDRSSGRQQMSAALCVQAFDVLTDNRRRAVGAHDWHVQALMRLGVAMGKRADHSVFLDEVLSIALSVTGAQRAILIASDTGGTHEILRTRLTDGHSGGDSAVEISWAVVSQVLASGEPSLFSDALTAEELSSHRSIAELKLRSLACVPLRAGGQVVGALYLDHHAIAGLIGQDMLGFLDLLAGLVGITLHMSRLEEQAVTARCELAETNRHIMRAERNRLAGELAGGLVHDLKNVLAAVSGRAQLLRRVNHDPQVLRSLDSIEKAAGTGVGLVQRLQECARDHSSQSEEPVDLTAVAHEAVELLGPRLERNRIRVDIQGAPDTVVWGVAGEYREMFLNLFVNACDAMPEGGVLSVVLGVDPQAAQVVATVSDTGVGMSAETQARLFEPFYTTKGNSGTGLGLVVVKSVVVRHGGSIAVQSELGGGGARFRVVLPCTRRR